MVRGSGIAEETEDALGHKGSSFGDTYFDKENSMTSLPGVPVKVNSINELWDLVHQKDEDLRHAAELGEKNGALVVTSSRECDSQLVSSALPVIPYPNILFTDLDLFLHMFYCCIFDLDVHPSPSVQISQRLVS